MNESKNISSSGASLKALNPQNAPIERVSGSDDLGSLAEILAEAFFDGDFYQAIMPDGSQRMRQLRWWMKALLNYGLNYGEVYQYGRPASGIAIWLTPKAPCVNPVRMFWSGFHRAPFQLGPQNLIKMLRITHEWESDQKKEAKNHWYLMALGVKPAAQGQGVGSALVSQIVDPATAAGFDCYLETQAEKNTRFYEKLHFKILGKREHSDPNHAFSCWSMRRERAVSDATAKLESH